MRLLHETEVTPNSGALWLAEDLPNRNGHFSDDVIISRGIIESSPWLKEKREENNTKEENGPGSRMTNQNPQESETLLAFFSITLSTTR